MFRASDLATSCPSQQAARIGVGRRSRRDAYARGQMDRVAGDVDWLSDGDKDAVGHGEHFVRRQVAIEQDPKLVPPRRAQVSAARAEASRRRETF